MIRVPESAARAAFLIGSTAIAALAAHAVTNSSGHTSLDPWMALLVFLPVALTGLLNRLTCSEQGCRALWGYLAIAAGLAGVLLLAYLDLSGTLLQYEAWIERGMP